MQIDFIDTEGVRYMRLSWQVPSVAGYCLWWLGASFLPSLNHSIVFGITIYREKTRIIECIGTY